MLKLNPIEKRIVALLVKSVVTKHDTFITATQNYLVNSGGNVIAMYNIHMELFDFYIPGHLKYKSTRYHDYASYSRAEDWIEIEGQRHYLSTVDDLIVFLRGFL